MIKILKHTIFKEKGIKVIEDKYNSKYIGDFEISGNMDFTKSGAVFYQTNPNLSKGHSNYFCIYNDYTADPNTYILILKNTYITKWDKLNFKGVKAGEDILISCHRHHYHEQDGIFIDGGFDYVRTNGEIVDVQLINGELIKI